jgi:hypothetical protein
MAYREEEEEEEKSDRSANSRWLNSRHACNKPIERVRPAPHGRRSIRSTKEKREKISHVADVCSFLFKK